MGWDRKTVSGYRKKKSRRTNSAYLRFQDLYQLIIFLTIAIPMKQLFLRPFPGVCPLGVECVVSPPVLN